MSQFFYIHPENPQARLINQAVDIVRKGGVIVYPTDSGYALGCKIEDKGAMERICRIRNLPNGHNFTLMCRDLSEPVDPRELQAEWQATVRAALSDAGLSIPEEAPFRHGGKQGLHSEHLGPLLAEMQYLQRAYPGQRW
mgnify:CR=1 FL=1